MGAASLAAITAWACLRPQRPSYSTGRRSLGRRLRLQAFILPAQSCNTLLAMPLCPELLLLSLLA